MLHIAILCKIKFGDKALHERSNRLKILAIATGSGQFCRMGKRGRVLYAALAVGMLTVMAWMLFRASVPEPVYGGKRLSEWLAQMESGDVVAKASEAELYEQGAHAVRQIGPAAIPTLLNLLRAQDSPLKAKLLGWAQERHFLKFRYTRPESLHERAERGFKVLGPRAASAVPELIKILDRNEAPAAQGSAAIALGCIGPDAKVAIPTLLRALVTSNQWVHGTSLFALSEIHADSDAVVAVLIRNLHDPRFHTRLLAVNALGNRKGDARPAIPALSEMLKAPGPNSVLSPEQTYLHREIRRALAQIDPGAYAEAVTNAPGASIR